MVDSPSSGPEAPAEARQKRRNQNKDTDFLWFAGEHRSSYDTEDIQSAAVRRARVKHV